MSLDQALEVLRRHREQLRSLGARHVAVFGSVARGEATDQSDVDVLVELDTEKRLDIFDYALIVVEIKAMFRGDVDVVNSRKIKHGYRESILRDAVNAF